MWKKVWKLRKRKKKKFTFSIFPIFLIFKCTSYIRSRILFAFDYQVVCALCNYPNGDINWHIRWYRFLFFRKNSFEIVQFVAIFVHERMQSIRCRLGSFASTKLISNQSLSVFWHIHCWKSVAHHSWSTYRLENVFARLQTRHTQKKKNNDENIYIKGGNRQSMDVVLMISSLHHPRRHLSFAAACFRCLYFFPFICFHLCL